LGAATPTGTVTLRGSAQAGATCTLVGGTCTTSFYAPSGGAAQNYRIVADYSGDVRDLPSTGSTTSFMNALPADLRVTQRSTIPSAGKIRIAVSVYNASARAARNVTFTDTLTSTTLTSVTQTETPVQACVPGAPPPGAQRQFTCSLPTLAAHGTFSFVLVAAGQARWPVMNAASAAAAKTVDPSPGNARSVYSAHFGLLGGLSVSQAATGPAGTGSAVITLVVHNSGTNATSVSLSDLVDSPGLMSVNPTQSNRPISCTTVAPTSPYEAKRVCTVSALASGANWSLTLTLTGPPGGALTNVASVSSSHAESQLTDNNGSVSTTYTA
jgi:hypothetical protein